MKKTISLILSAALLAVNAVFPVNAAFADEPDGLTKLKTDDFNSYTASASPITGKGSEFAGTWQLTGVSDSLDSNADVQLAEDPKNPEEQAVKIRTYFVYNWYGGHPSITPTDVEFEDGNKYRFKFDFYRTDNTDCVGLRFHNADGTWKALYFAGKGDRSYDHISSSRTKYSTVILNGNAGSATRVLNVAEGPSDDEDCVAVQKPGSTATSGRDMYYVQDYGGTWYTVETEVEEGIMTWTVKDRESGTVVQTGQYNSQENILNPKTDVELFAGGANSHYAYFDNFEVSKYSNYIPMKACIDLTEGQNLTSGGKIRFNQLSGGYVTAINCPSLAGQSVELSKDGTDFTSVSLDENGVWSAGAEMSKYTYIKLPTSVKPDDLLVFGDMEKDGCDIIYRRSFKIYSVFNGVNTGVMTSGVIDEDGVVSFDIGVITGVVNGEDTDVLFTSNDRKKRTVNVKVIDELSLLEAAEDTEAIAAYVAAQQPTLDILNAAITGGDIAAVDTFFSSTDTADVLNAIACMDGAVYRDLKANNPEKYNRFIARIMSYTDGFHCQSTAEEIRGIEETFKKEVAVGNLENLASTDDVVLQLSENSKVLGINLDSFYDTYKFYVCPIFVSAEFENLKDLEKKLYERIVLITTEECINPTLITKLIEDYESLIGYNKTHYESIADKTLFGNAYAAAREKLTDLGKIKDFVDTYTPQITPTPTPAPSAPSSSGGGGGGHVTSYVDTKDKDEKTAAEPTVKPVVEKKEIYSDVPINHWSYEAIRFLDAREAVNGYDDGSFKPEASITRAEFIKTLINTFGADVELAEDYEMPFADVSEEAWYYESIAKAQLLGIINGTDGMCRPNDKITRQELAVLTYRMVEAMGKTLKKSVDAEKFIDEGEISDWAKTIVLKMQVAGILNGTDGRFMPHSETTRAMAAQILYKTVLCFEEPVKEGETADEK